MQDKDRTGTSEGLGLHLHFLERPWEGATPWAARRTARLQAGGQDAPDGGLWLGLRFALRTGRLRTEKWVPLPGPTTDCCFEQPASSLLVLVSHPIREGAWLFRRG